MRLQQHSARPKAKFRGENEPYYLGIELEVEAPDSDKRDLGLDLRKRPRHFYAKRDGSLNCYGWELITHPIGKSLWLERHPKDRSPVRQLFDLVADLKTMGYSSHDGGRCGLHIHLCHKAFGAFLTETNHYYWFSRLINGELFRKLSQRDDESLNRWTQQIKKGNRYEFTRARSYRYQASNITEKTVEVRLFRGNMREDRIRKALEAVIAAVEYSRTLAGWPTSDIGTDVQFVEWVQRHSYTYPHLVAYLNTLALNLAQEEIPA